MGYCRKCGNETVEGDKFCGICGETTKWWRDMQNQSNSQAESVSTESQAVQPESVSIESQAVQPEIPKQIQEAPSFHWEQDESIWNVSDEKLDISWDHAQEKREKTIDIITDYQGHSRLKLTENRIYYTRQGVDIRAVDLSEGGEVYVKRSFSAVLIVLSIAFLGIPFILSLVMIFDKFTLESFLRNAANIPILMLLWIIGLAALLDLIFRKRFSIFLDQGDRFISFVLGYGMGFYFEGKRFERSYAIAKGDLWRRNELEGDGASVRTEDTDSNQQGNKAPGYMYYCPKCKMSICNRTGVANGLFSCPVCNSKLFALGVSSDAWDLLGKERKSDIVERVINPVG